MGEQDWGLISSYAGILSLATLSIYIGSFGSLTSVKRRATQEESHKVDRSDDEDDDEEDIPDLLSSEDAWLFPVIGSVLLFGLYLIVKFFGKEWINWVLGWYFAITGVGSMWKSSIALAKKIVGVQRWRQFDSNCIIFLKGRRELLSISLRTPSIFLFPVAAAPSLLYTFSNGTTRKSALLTDILALSFAQNAVSLLKLDSFKTGVILESGLFLYDIWWVFGTDVMVKVATTLDVPIKILWPKSLFFSSEAGFTMLGLGDIVIPGAFVSLALRYDAHRWSLRQSPGVPGAASAFPKPYFYSALVCYVLGLTTTIVVMHVFGRAQPALLYLSPACIISFLVPAIWLGDLQQAWGWTDEAPNPKEGLKDKASLNGMISKADGKSTAMEDSGHKGIMRRNLGSG